MGDGRRQQIAKDEEYARQLAAQYAREDAKPWQPAQRPQAAANVYGNRSNTSHDANVAKQWQAFYNQCGENLGRASRTHSQSVTSPDTSGDAAYAKRLQESMQRRSSRRSRHSSQPRARDQTGWLSGETI